jgi:hypothetical protein
MGGGETGGAPPPARRAGRGRSPGRGWYAVAALVAVATLAVTGALAFGRVTELVDRVDGFTRFNAPGGANVEVSDPGHYGVYHEYLRPTAGPGSPDSEFGLTVVGPDGAAVDVRPSDVTYGWGSRRGAAVGEFEAEQPGSYQVVASAGAGQLAVGERMPGGLLRGFGGPVAAASAVLAGCAILALIVGARRRRRRPQPVGPPAAAPSPPPTTPDALWPPPTTPDAPWPPPVTPGAAWPSPAPGELATPAPAFAAGTAVPPLPQAGPPERRNGWVAPVATVAVLALMVGGVAAAAVAGRVLDDRAEQVGTTGASGPPPAVDPEVDCGEMSNIENGLCGPTPEQLREMNLAYADRLPFGGDPEAAAVVADDVRTALAPLAGALPAPAPDQVQEALARWAPGVVVSTNAVRTAGTAFAVSVEGGCVFGSVHDGQVDVEVGGYVNDGGCLAEYGH